MEKIRLMNQPPRCGSGSGQFNCSGEVPVAILEAPVPQGYLRLSDGSVLACYVCTPPVFMRKNELMIPHKKKKKKGKSHKKVLMSMVACNRPCIQRQINFSNTSATVTSQLRRKSMFKLF
nr:hypothetical protein [Tanacetum cinerariifolium]